MNINTRNILKENEQRNDTRNAYFNPITGEGSVGKRRRVEIKDYPIHVQYLPVEMLKVPLVKGIIKYGSIEEYFIHELADEEEGIVFDDEALHKIVEQLTRIRFRFDFAFWAAFLVYIKPKGGGDDVLFNLTRPQRRLVEKLEAKRKAGKPIRLVLLKARQWGGSTTIQMYFAWLQLVHKVGLNSLIVAQVKGTATKIQNMFNKMLKKYPTEYLYKLGTAYDARETKWAGVGATQDTHKIPQRNCTITVGSAEKPDSVRGDDYNLVHLSEVGLWKKTEGKTPEDIVRSACSGIAMQPYTAIIYESTANGTGNFFQREYDAAKNGKSSFEALFVAWFEIELYWKPFENDKERNALQSVYIRTATTTLLHQTVRRTANTCGGYGRLVLHWKTSTGTSKSERRTTTTEAWLPNIRRTMKRHLSIRVRVYSTSRRWRNCVLPAVLPDIWATCMPTAKRERRHWKTYASTRTAKDSCKYGLCPKSTKRNVWPTATLLWSMSVDAPTRLTGLLSLCSTACL